MYIYIYLYIYIYICIYIYIFMVSDNAIILFHIEASFTKVMLWKCCLKSCLFCKILLQVTILFCMCKLNLIQKVKSKEIIVY